ncbi:MAG TPA: serine/threonine-protein kinase [Candidatus Dormibacteraeota bacterium]|nr:serine/threonine-protein kinase [Candidatus Dormibacteraeota bacterium]
MQVGRYEILGIVNEGSSGRVFRAHDPLIGRIVAIKLLSPQFGKGEAYEKFVQEARVVGQLSHPSIVTLHDMGVEETSTTPYLVMEFIEGQALNELLPKGRVPFPKACAWAGDVATALAAVHRKGVIHGDIKPANIFITKEGRVKLGDFGIARVQNNDNRGVLMGTPAYWCPEQIWGKPQDARSDLFSLGVVLYEMVTGKRPFEGKTIEEVREQILSAKPVVPSIANSSLPAALNLILDRCLSKDPARRYADGDALAAELYPLARRKPVNVPARGAAVALSANRC